MNDLKIEEYKTFSPKDTKVSKGNKLAVYGSNKTYFNLTIKALKLWKKFQQDWDKELMVNTGVLWMGDNLGLGIVNSALKLFEANGIPFKEYSPGQASKIFHILIWREFPAW